MKKIKKIPGGWHMDEKIIAQNEQIKADPTDGMNKLDEMDLEMPEGLAFSMAMNGKR